jgi:hypothetical protein
VAVVTHQVNAVSENQVAELADTVAQLLAKAQAVEHRQNQNYLFKLAHTQ